MLRLAVLLPVVWVLYTWQLDQAPVHLSHDEVLFGLNAHAIASTGQDLSGQAMPIFFSDRSLVAGQDPLRIYFAALVLKVLPFTEHTLRLVTVFVGIIDVVLIFFVARRLFDNDALALWAAACLALTPAHLLYSRVAVDILFGLPFMLAWLYLLLRFEDQGNLTMLFASTCALGLSVYGYKSAELVAPTYLLLTCIAAYGKTRQPRSCGIALAGFLVAVAPFVVALALHPERYRTMVAFYHVYDRNLNPLQGLHDLVRYESVGNRLGAYWGQLSPSFLFFFGDVSVPDSTRRAGVFLWPISIFLVLGLYHARHTRLGWLMSAGFLLAPIVVLIEPIVTTRRTLPFVAFGALLATSGWKTAIGHSRASRVAAIILVVLAMSHFTWFYVDYLTDYRERSSAWREYNLRGALEELLMQDAHRGRADRIYLSIENPFVQDYVQFYTLKHSRGDLRERIEYREPRATDPPRALVVRQVVQESALRAACAAPIRLNLLATIREPDGTPSFILCAT